MSRLDFRNIVARNGSPDDAFEEFCCQLARRGRDVPTGSEFLRYRGAGGDGGVECIWRLPNGEEWGWQVKYLFDLSSAKAALDKSIQAAIKVHPRLTIYTICLPFNLTGPTGRAGKSEQERFDTYRVAWQAEASAAGVILDIRLETESTLLDALLSFDPDGGRRVYWFDETILTDSWFRHHRQKSVEHAGPRYTPDLNVETDLTGSFDAFCLSSRWTGLLQHEARRLSALAERWREALRSDEDGLYQAVFPAELRQNGREAGDKIEPLWRQLLWAAEQTELREEELAPFLARIADAAACFRVIRAELMHDLDERYGQGAAESVSFRQRQAEYMGSHPTSNVDLAKEIVDLLERTHSLAARFRLTTSHAMLLLGVAGSGKTHAICDVARLREEEGMRTVVLFGDHFHNDAEPWEQVRQQLSLPPEMSAGAFLAAMDTAGEASGKPLLLCIDGLNETRPLAFWRNRLAGMAADISKYTWLRFCVACRTSYAPNVVPQSSNAFIEVTHSGFAGREFDACQAFFRHFDLNPPVTPMLQAEFGNPLFLRLICRAIKENGGASLPPGWQGIYTAVRAIVAEKNRRYAEEKAIFPESRIPQKGIGEFLEATRRERSTGLPWSQAASAVDSALPQGYRTHDSLLEWLIREDVLIVDAAPVSTAPTLSLLADAPEEVVRIAFERLGDHLLADRFLEGTAASSLRGAFGEGGIFTKLLANEEDIGLIEAMLVQIPERFGIEAVQLWKHNERMPEWLLMSALAALPWRDPALFTAATGDLIRAALDLSGHVYAAAFDAILAVSVHTSSIDAFWLDDLLRLKSMGERDGFWCGYLHQRYEKEGPDAPVQRVIRLVFVSDTARMDEEMVERWAVTLLWFCAAADRRIRDGATKALVRLTEVRPTVWVALIKRFLGLASEARVDDDYVIERCLAAAYGALLRNHDRLAEAAVAGTVIDCVFSDTTRFQNAMIRDYARCIVEMAALDGGLGRDVAEEEYLPPYQSEWPLNVPSDDEIASYDHVSRQMPKLRDSCFDDDFFKYTMSCVDQYCHAGSKLTRRGLARWIFQHVLKLGYLSSPGNATYDAFMVTVYGDGREKPVWAERIGKKYQLIALSRLMARLTDHVRPERNVWDQEEQRTSLTYMQGRDIDPSVLHRASLQSIEMDESSPPPMFDFQQGKSMTDGQWIMNRKDIPDSSAFLSVASSLNEEWLVLGTSPSWRLTDEDTGDYRYVWMQIRSYLVARSDATKCWAWLRQQHFYGRWMPEGARLSNEGFIGEYPWATPFNIYPDTFFESGGSSSKLPYQLLPTANALASDYEEDSYQRGRIELTVPSKHFFRTVPDLRWDGAGGFRDGRQLAFICQLREEGEFPVLLAHRQWLLDYLERKQKVLMWTVLGAKQVVSDTRRSGMLEFSLAHRLVLDGGEIKSSKLIAKPYP